jgi:hypothetical protein
LRRSNVAISEIVRRRKSPKNPENRLQEDLPGIPLIRVTAVLNTTSKGKEFRMIKERIERFKCSAEFHPYLIKVLERLPEDVLCQKILNGSWLEIASFNPDTARAGNPSHDCP